MATEVKRKNKYVYGPVSSWRSGVSLGIDPIGDISTCSFNCVYCQLGKIQNITNEIKTYIKTEDIIEDLLDFEKEGLFSFDNLDVITFAGSGEPCLAENLGEIIDEINKIQDLRIEEGILNKRVKISILTNATMFHNKEVRERAKKVDLISLKLDAPNDKYLKQINQPAEGITMDSIITGIKKFKEEYRGESQLQMMFLPKYLKEDNFIEDLAELILETKVDEVQINTPTRPKPTNGKYHIESRGNHPAKENTDVDIYETIDLPVITKEEAFHIEDRIKEIIGKKMPELKFQNVYLREYHKEHK